MPEGLSDYEDLLVPERAGGRIAVIDPAIDAGVLDFYLWMEENSGRWPPKSRASTRAPCRSVMP